MRICLFDWNEGGHHAEVAKAFAAALHPGAEVVLVAPEATLRSVGETTARTVSLGAARPRPVPAGRGPFGGTVPSKSELAERELELIGKAVSEVEPDHLILLWGEPVLRWLLREPPLPTRVSLYIALSRLHYPLRYRTRFTPGEWASALFKELNLLRWARRPDSHALFCIDREAARRLSRYPGADARYLGEPPLSYLPQVPAADEKRGCVLFGYLDERKGVDRVAAAVAEGCEGLELSICGEPSPEYAPQLEREIARMRAGGVRVDAHLARLPYEEALDRMAAARAALLSFGWIPPGSRVLLEAATAGTPAIGSSRGAVGHLIRTHELGLTVDPDDTQGLRKAIQELAMRPGAAERFAGPLREYADELNGDHYRTEVRSALGLPA